MCPLYFGKLLDNPGPQFKIGLLMPGIEIFVRWSLALDGTIVTLDETFSFQLYMHTYIKNYM